jgi:Zn-dependent protease
MLAAAALDSPLFWAVLIGWILSVTLHELGHGVAAHFGGDYTIRERGGLTLNPLYYVDPFTSILLPAIFLAIGGIPLPGGATYVRTDLLHNRRWESVVALAGPAVNVVLFFAFALPLHPSVGWYAGDGRWTPGQLFCGAMATLQFLALCFNLVPVPPLDGFRAIAPLLGREQEEKLLTPPTPTILFLAFFFAVWKIPAILRGFLALMEAALRGIGFGETAEHLPAMFGDAVFERG